jgi:prolipoprotein diacylglyceryltransferase
MDTAPREWSPAYAAFMLLALAVYLSARRVLPQPPAVVALPRWKKLGLALAAFVGGALGAKLPFVLEHHPTQWLAGAAWFSDGKTIVAGLIGAYLAVELAKPVLEVRVKTGDSFAAPLAFAMAVGRWGCFCHGCCYGTATTLPWGVWFNTPDGPMKCHPTQIYESLFHFTMGLMLVWLAFRDALPCQRLKLYLIAYGVYRFLTEYIRPEPTRALGLTFYQWASLLLVGGLVVQWVVDRSAARPTLAPAGWTTGQASQATR